MKKITIIAGARPNFIKIAPIIDAIKSAKGSDGDRVLEYRLVHTGQHYDAKMSQTFFDELNIPSPDVNLSSGGGSQAEQTASIMIAFEKELAANPTDLVLVVGDVTSTMACAIVAKKSLTRVIHVEAGIRSFDLSMPEEINRMVTDSITDFFFTTSETANGNLRDMGVKEEAIFFVGNVMIDTLLKNKPRFTKPGIWNALGLEEKQYLIITMHRPSNVDEGVKLKKLLHEVTSHARGLPILFPIHPRTRQIFEKLEIHYPNLHVIDPLGYLEFNYLVERSKMVITDSGGITEETTVLGVPCMTIRDNTERPETVSVGTNELIGTDPQKIRPMLEKLFDGNWKKGSIPDLWDGEASLRIVNHLIKLV